MAGTSAHPVNFILFRLLVITLVATAHLSVSAATLNGVIFANEENGEPMANVGLVAEGANPTISDTFGRFRLEFPHNNPGDPVKVIVKRDGYVVVNDVQLVSALPAKPADTILTIILCKDVDREEMARRFYRLKSDEAINESQ